MGRGGGGQHFERKLLTQGCFKIVSLFLCLKYSTHLQNFVFNLNRPGEGGCVNKMLVTKAEIHILCKGANMYFERGLTENLK